MNNLFFDTVPLANIDDAYRHYNAKQFASPTRSTIPLLSWLKHEDHAFQTLLTTLGISGDSYHIEYRVMPEDGKPQPSQTDLMVVGSASALAIEAKWTEGEDNTVKKWRRDGNKETVFGWWLKQLQRHASGKLSIDMLNEVEYQTIHRTASACATSENPALAYLVFRDKHSPKNHNKRDNLVNFWHLLGNPRSLPFYYIEVAMTTTEWYDPILKLPKNNTGTIEDILMALRSEEKLFNFSDPQIDTIK